MADKASKPIALPPGVRANLENLIRVRDEATAQIQAIVATAMECQDVPEGWQLNNIARGFEPPPEQPQPDGGLE